MEVDVEYLNKWASLTGECARLEAKLFDSYIVYMNKSGQFVKEHTDGRIEIIEEAKEIRAGREAIQLIEQSILNKQDFSNGNYIIRSTAPQTNLCRKGKRIQNFQVLYGC